MKKIVITSLIFMMVAVNFIVLIDKNEMSTLTLSSLIKIASADTEDYPLPEVVVKPSEKTQDCTYEGGFSIGISVGLPAGLSISWGINYDYGIETVCSEENGDGCTPIDCA